MFEAGEQELVGSALDEQVPGAAELGAVDYVERLLTALDHDPPHVWAGPDGWLDLGPWERHAWRARIGELRAVYDRVLAGATTPDDAHVLHQHAIEATYGDPAYGGNRHLGGWQRIDFPEPVFPPARGPG